MPISAHQTIRRRPDWPVKIIAAILQRDVFIIQNIKIVDRKSRNILSLLDATFGISIGFAERMRAECHWHYVRMSGVQTRTHEEENTFSSTHAYTDRVPRRL